MGGCMRGGGKEAKKEKRKLKVERKREKKLEI
jgi:hypothetical protein